MSSEIGPISHIDARVRDIQPNQARARLEVYFQADDAAWLPSQHRGEVEIEIRGVRWMGTVGLKPPNPPYLHSGLRSGNGKKTVSDLMLEMDVAPTARIRFRVLEPSKLQFDHIVDQGRWPSEGGLPAAMRASAQVSELRNRENAHPPAPAAGAFPIDDANAIRHWAGRYWELITNREASEERAFERDMPFHRGRAFLTKEIFVRLARWKSPRKTPDYESNTDHEIEQASRRAFSAENDDDAITSMTALRGVALRTATALLHWMSPTLYPILDFRVVGALGLSEPSNWDSVEFYTRVTDPIRAIARKLGVDLRTVDRALWAWNKASGVG
jgi:hypothetical protein